MNPKFRIKITSIFLRISWLRTFKLSILFPILTYIYIVWAMKCIYMLLSCCYYLFLRPHSPKCLAEAEGSCLRYSKPEESLKEVFWFISYCSLNLDWTFPNRRHLEDCIRLITFQPTDKSQDFQVHIFNEPVLLCTISLKNHVGTQMWLSIMGNMYYIFLRATQIEVFYEYIYV